MLGRAASRSTSAQCRNISTRATARVTPQHPVFRAPTASYHARAYRKQQHFFRSVFAIAVVGGAATLLQYSSANGALVGTSHADSPPDAEENPLIFEASRKRTGASKEENRDLISSQHHQVKRSWEAPGLHAWGDNRGRVVAPDSTETVIKTPRRISFFDGKLLRDVKLDQYFAAAIDERGDLLQWGIAYDPDCRQPTHTLKGKDLISLTLSRDRILALAKNGTLYSLPISGADQAEQEKPVESSWIPFWSSKSQISYRTIAPSGLTSSEKVSSIAGGLDHALLLTSKGRLFSTAASSSNYPDRGQLGIPGLTFMTRPDGRYDQPHEISTLKGFNIERIACGDHHSLALDSEGRLFTWGDNASGQLGFDYSVDSAVVDAPSLVPLQKLYQGSSQIPKITSIAAGGANSYLTVDATKVAAARASSAEDLRGVGKVTADVFSFGTGIYGGLANNRWTHVQGTPAKIPTLSGLFEYDETNNTTVPIRLSHMSIGATHGSAVMKNITYLAASNSTSNDDTNWGADIVFFGGNEHYQLGTGRRNNVATPVYIQPLDMDEEIKRAKKSSGKKEEHRFHITPRTTAKLGDGRRVSVEQRIECGRYTTCVYSGT